MGFGAQGLKGGCGGGIAGCEGQVQHPFAQQPFSGQPQAKGRQHPGQGMQQHPRQTQGLGQAADVLAAGAAVAAKHRMIDGMALLHRHPFDRLGHAGRGNGDSPLGHLFGAVAEATGRLQLPRQCRQDVS